MKRHRSLRLTRTDVELQCSLMSGHHGFRAGILCLGSFAVVLAGCQGTTDADQPDSGATTDQTPAGDEGDEIEADQTSDPAPEASESTVPQPDPPPPAGEVLAPSYLVEMVHNAAPDQPVLATVDAVARLVHTEVVVRADIACPGGAPGPEARIEALHAPNQPRLQRTSGCSDPAEWEEFGPSTLAGELLVPASVDGSTLAQHYGTEFDAELTAEVSCQAEPTARLCQAYQNLNSIPVNPSTLTLSVEVDDQDRLVTMVFTDGPTTIQLTIDDYGIPVDIERPG